MSDDFTGPNEPCNEFADIMSLTLTRFNKLKKKKKLGPLAKRSMSDFRNDEKFPIKDDQKLNNTRQRSEPGNQIRRMNFEDFLSVESDFMCGRMRIRKRDVFDPMGRPDRMRDGLGEPE